VDDLKKQLEQDKLSTLNYIKSLNIWYQIKYD
jgi:hypothetical protein